MRDYTLGHMEKVTQAQKQPYHTAWSAIPALVAAVEIANSTKHFVLRDRKTGRRASVKTRAVRMKKSGFANIYANAAGELKVVHVQRTEVHVTLSDGRILELYAFTDQVLEYWRGYLVSLGMTVRRQPFALLTGRDNK